MRNKMILATTIVSISLLFTSCGKSVALTEYQNAMTSFSENITRIDGEMNTIDSSSETAVDDLLACLTSMNEEFTKLAALEVPEQFSSVESLADEASEYMSQAVDLYKQVFSTTPYDEYSSVLADESYKRAMKRIQYIGEILQGQVPEGDDITVFEEGEEPTTIDETLEDTSDYEVPAEDLLEE